MSGNNIDVITRFQEARGDQETSCDGDFQSRSNSLIPDKNVELAERCEEDLQQEGNGYPQVPLYTEISSESPKDHPPTMKNSIAGYEPVTFYDFMPVQTEPFPGFIPVSLLCLRQTTPIRKLCLRMILSR